jgi:glycosyltransferase involved in cell wall biosynthesis
VLALTAPPRAIVIEIDHDRTGSAATRNRALAKVDTEWVAFLDDDEEFLPQHLERVTAGQRQSGADVATARRRRHLLPLARTDIHLEPLGHRPAR